MPKRTDIQSICIIGAGPIIIGQACEFDYSGVQACKALRDEGYRTILVNSNPATIMTDPEVADVTYIEPVTPAIVAKILEREKPDALLPTMGGQTALNVAMALADDGTLDRLGVELIGARRESIAMAEDRQLFRDAMDKIGLGSPRSRVVRSLEEAQEALVDIGLPVIIRPSFTLAGTGGGIAYNRSEFAEIVAGGLAASPTHEVLVEESVLGWKEYEMEVVRDRADNSIIVCSIENIDPMGVHTGDSITVAPALTLTDKEYQAMRDASLAVLRVIGVDTGGSNVQFAINPRDGRMLVIEMNPRVSRSSALASKATGFPIAKVAAKLSVGYTLDELRNEITGGAIPASFEPALDYVVTKIPRFAFEKFPGSDPTLTTSMKSVGEVMAIGRTFAESLQKALRGLETGLSGLDTPKDLQCASIEAVQAALGKPAPERLLVAAEALRRSMSIEEVRARTAYDPWFLRQLKDIIDVESAVTANGLPNDEDTIGWRRIKSMGFSDKRLALLAGTKEATVAAMRQHAGVVPVYRRIDTCAAEFASTTPYLYSTYEGDIFNPPVCEACPSARNKVVIIGGGPNRIGQGIEFDYCCVHAVQALRSIGYETIMVNCNPETVSTDYDTSDRLYFEPLTAEDVISILRCEQAKGTLLGVMVQFGGQTPLGLARSLADAGINILGTSPDAIDLAEDRERFQVLLKKLKLRQPANGLARTAAEAEKIAAKVGYPVVIRPSYVLGGRAMEIVYDVNSLRRYIDTAVSVSGNNPVLIDHYLQDAVEVDVDVVADGDDVFVAGIMEHIEEAGIHSGDSSCVLPPHSLSAAVVSEIRRQSDQLAKAIGVIGLMNVQFAVKDETVFILEVNPRASRTVPFVAKAIGFPLAKIAAQIMVGRKLREILPQLAHNGANVNQAKNAINNSENADASKAGDTAEFIPANYTHNGASGGHHRYAVKEAVFPFARFPGVDIVLGPEMRSTGEVMGLDSDFAHAFAKAQLGAGVKLPLGGTCFVSVRDKDKKFIKELAVDLLGLGFKLIATGGTAAAISEAGLPVTRVNKVFEGQPHIVDAVIDGGVHLVINTSSESPQNIADGFSLRRTALMHGIPHYTTLAGARAAIKAIAALQSGALDVSSLQESVTGNTAAR